MTASPLHIFVNGTEAPQSVIYLPISISHGRSDVTTQPDAPQINMTWLDDASAPQIGDRVHALVDLPGGASQGTYDDPVVSYDDPRVTYSGDWLSEVDRFDGYVTDRIVHEQGGQPGEVQVIAVGGHAKLGLRQVSLDRPQEDDIARVRAIADAVGIPLVTLGNPGPPLLAGLVAGTALSAIQQVCASSGGLLWQNTDGVIYYGSGDHRRIGEPLAAIGAHEILDELNWDSKIGDMINRITVSYGQPAGSVTVTDDISISLYDTREHSASTQLVDQGAADQFAALILARRAFPFAQITDIMLDSSAAPEVMQKAMLLSVSDAILLPIPADPGPTGLLAEWIVEGWQEEWSEPTLVKVQFAVSDRARFALTMLRFWSHALEQTWQDELDRGTWLDALILQPGEAA